MTPAEEQKFNKIMLLIIIVTAIISFSSGMIIMHNIEKDKAEFYREQLNDCVPRNEYITLPDLTNITLRPKNG